MIFTKMLQNDPPCGGDECSIFKNLIGRNSVGGCIFYFLFAVAGLANPITV